jgi:TonB family protein
MGGPNLFLLIALASATVSATPRADPHTWLGPDDYPKASIASEAEGAVTVAIDVDEKGKPSSCSVTSSSGDNDLDSLTCSLLVKRAQFIPAKGQRGQAATSQYSQKVTWRIPREKLITRGFKLTFGVERDGRLSNCEMVKYDFQDNDLQCDPQMIDVMAEKMLPAPLASYRSVSLLLAMEVEQSGIAIPRQMDEDRTIIFSATAGISLAGIITTCKAEVTRDWMGKSSDLCGGPITVGEKEFDPDPQGKSRKLTMTLEISGVKR